MCSGKAGSRIEVLLRLFTLSIALTTDYAAKHRMQSVMKLRYRYYIINTDWQQLNALHGQDHMPTFLSTVYLECVLSLLPFNTGPGVVGLMD